MRLAALELPAPDQKQKAAERRAQQATRQTEKAQAPSRGDLRTPTVERQESAYPPCPLLLARWLRRERGMEYPAPAVFQPAAALNESSAAGQFPELPATREWPQNPGE
jgi:hypothetical protein